ncbi:MAG: NAD-dependent epimerase/dehydratase family protein [Halanaerobiales bacterium]
MRTLVTGVAGFIGSHLAERLLNQGHEVIGIDCFTDYYAREIKEHNLDNVREHEKFIFMEKNILNLNLNLLLVDTDVIFHQAAQAGVRNSWGKSFEIYDDNNILATQKLLEAARKADIKKFVYASSSSVYGDVEELPMTEDSRLKPVSPYGVSKLAGENLCYLYWKNFLVPTVSLRYFTVFGERQRPDMAFHIFMKSILQGEPITIFGDGKQSRNFTHVDDVVKANIQAAVSDVEGEILNIGGDGERIELNEAISIIEDIMGSKAEKKYQSMADGDVRHTAADCSRARELLDYDPVVGFREGLEREAAWIREIYGEEGIDV